MSLPVSIMLAVDDGEDLREIVAAALAVAKRNLVPVKFMYRGKDIKVAPHSDVHRIVQRYLRG